jgi:glycosyltransferase involved in cell wall biosynthesis
MLKRNTSFVIISSGQPCGNPRMVKEAIALRQAGNQIKVIYCPLSPWGDAFDQELFQENHSIEWIRVGAHPIHQKRAFFWCRIRKKVWEWVYRVFGDVCDASLKSSVLFSQELRKAAVSQKAQIYIGHNLGSIGAVRAAATKFKGKACFDFEDYHRGEDVENSFHWQRVKQIEDKYIPWLNTATASSPLIREAYQTNYSEIKIKSILNVFPKPEIDHFVSSDSSCLSLFWFSQFVGWGRGFEQIIHAAAHLSPQPTITLLGNCSDQMKHELLVFSQESGFDGEKLIFKGAIPANKIPLEAAKHHIGICSEDPETLNRDLCLTNKVFTYMSSKNALLLSNTKSQERFLKENPGIGQLYNNNDIDALVRVLQCYQSDRALLEKHRVTAYQLSQETFNWENEQQKLLSFYAQLTTE